jgi:hypothetical protein
VAQLVILQNGVKQLMDLLVLDFVLACGTGAALLLEFAQIQSTLTQYHLLQLRVLQDVRQLGCCDFLIEVDLIVLSIVLLAGLA